MADDPGRDRLDVLFRELETTGAGSGCEAEVSEPDLLCRTLRSLLHDVRTPLVAIQGLSSLICKADADPAKVTPTAKLIGEAARELDRKLEFMRAVARSLTKEHKGADLRSLLIGWSHRLAERFGREGVALTPVVPEEGTLLTVEDEGLQGTLEGLLHLLVKDHGEALGSVRLSCAPAPELGEVSFCFTCKGSIGDILSPQQMEINPERALFSMALASRGRRVALVADASTLTVSCPAGFETNTG